MTSWQRSARSHGAPWGGDVPLPPLEESRSAVLVLATVGGLPNDALAALAGIGTTDQGVVQGRLADVQLDDYDDPDDDLEWPL